VISNSNVNYRDTQSTLVSNALIWLNYSASHWV